MAADWTQLPNDILHHISKRLRSSLDIIRFRSVCSTWRSIVTPPPCHSLAPWSNSSGSFTLLNRRIFLIGSPKTNIHTKPSTSWIIKIEHVCAPKRIRFLNPLSKSLDHSLPYNFPEGFNSFDFRVLKLGEEYMLHNLVFLYMRKVVVSRSDSNVNDFVLLSINYSGKLAMFKFSDQRWNYFPEATYDDVIFYKGNFYAVDSRCRTLVVGLDSETTSVVRVPTGLRMFDDRKKYLVESKGELLLVVGMIRVFKLDEVGKEWIEINDLGDGVLFLGDNCAFAASAEDLYVPRGNYIVFLNSRNVCVFDLEDGSIRPLSKFPQLDKLFSPPSSWIS
ncbi:hypothetical protein PTKIN_Ptkin10aG0167100 [Pterospermum kingtungense]